MSFQRVLLKNQGGVPVAGLTISARPPRVSLPEGIRALYCLSGDRIFPVEGSAFPLASVEDGVSILAARGEEILYASTLPPKEAAFAKWRLLSVYKEGQRAEASPVISPTESLEPPSRAEERERDFSASEMEEIGEGKSTDAPSEAVVKSALERAEALIERGTSFTLFEQYMPGSRWAIVKEEAEYLVGITTDEDGTHVLFGVPGARDYPPDEDRLWSFFPTGEDEEIGYFLTEATELDM